MDCVICARHHGERPHENPVGGYVYEDEHWYAYHAPVARSVVGQLFLVSKRHYLDFAEMTSEEATAYGHVLRRLCAALKQIVPAERVYALVTLEGVPHFHVWLIPRRSDTVDRGWALITGDRSCSEADARETVARLRKALDTPS